MFWCVVDAKGELHDEIRKMLATTSIRKET